MIAQRRRREVRRDPAQHLGIVAAHAIAEEAQHALLHHLPILSGAVVHVDPCLHAGDDPTR